MSSGEETIPSPYRNPAASSKSAPGVRMVTATVCLEPPETRRISIGSSVARTSGRTRALPSSTTRTRTFVLLVRLEVFLSTLFSVRARTLMLSLASRRASILLMLRLMGLPRVERFPEATVTREDEKLVIHFGGLGHEQVMSIPLEYVGAEDEEAAELRLLAQLQRIGYRVERGSPQVG